VKRYVNVMSRQQLSLTGAAVMRRCMLTSHCHTATVLSDTWASCHTTASLHVTHCDLRSTQFDHCVLALFYAVLLLTRCNSEPV